MYSIGDLAQLAGVSPRMLRHYHALGLLVPAQIDPTTGYRRYRHEQLTELRHILALKGLGFSLDDIGRAVDDGMTSAGLHAMLLLRRTELRAELAQVTDRLQRLDAQIIRLEQQMNPQPRNISVTTKPLPAAHLAVASALSPGFGPAHIGPVIRPLYPKLIDTLKAAAVEILGPSIAYYEDAGDDGVIVHAGFPIHDSIDDVPGLEVVDLPSAPLAAVAVHHGDMSTCDVDTVFPMFEWLRANRYRTTGYMREHYLHCPEDIAAWRTEMQFPIEADQ